MDGHGADPLFPASMRLGLGLQLGCWAGGRAPGFALVDGVSNGSWEDMGHRGSSPTSEPEEPSLCLGRGWILAIFPHSEEIGFPLEIVSLDHSCKVLSLSTQAVCSTPSHCSYSFGILGGRTQNIVAKCTGYGVRQT